MKLLRNKLLKYLFIFVIILNFNILLNLKNEAKAEKFLLDYAPSIRFSLDHSGGYFTGPDGTLSTMSAELYAIDHDTATIRFRVYYPKTAIDNQGYTRTFLSVSGTPSFYTYYYYPGVSYSSGPSYNRKATNVRYSTADYEVIGFDMDFKSADIGNTYSYNNWYDASASMMTFKGNYTSSRFSQDVYFMGYPTNLVQASWFNDSPVLNLSSPTEGEIVSAVSGYRNLSISGTLTDGDVGDIEKIYYKVDGGPINQLGTNITATGGNQAISYSLDLSSYADGIHNITLWVEDNYGGKTANISKTFKINRNPNINITTPTENVTFSKLYKSRKEVA